MRRGFGFPRWAALVLPCTFLQLSFGHAHAATAGAGDVKTDCEFGVSLAEGNTSDRSLSSACQASYSIERWKFSSKGDVNWGQARYGGRGVFPDTGEEIPRGGFQLTKNNWKLSFREDLTATRDGRLTFFAREGAASDQFKGFWLRWILQSGASYALVQTAPATLRAELALDYNRDIFVEPAGSTEDRLGASLGLFGEHAFNEIVQGDWSVIYTPSFDAVSDYRIDAEAAINVQMSERLALRTGIELNFDNEPSLITPRDPDGNEVAGADPVPARELDTRFTTTLVVSIL